MNICQDLISDQVLEPIHKKRHKKRKRRPPNKPAQIGTQIEAIELDRVVRTEPGDNKQRRTLLLQRRTDTDSWGFTLQSYGLRNKGSREVDLVTYVDYVAITSPAHQAGLRQGDVILSIDGENMEDYGHSDLVAYIRHCGTRMRMVVLFENCVRKVELHARYLKLQRLMMAKEMELRSLEAKERKIKSGGLKDANDPSRLSLASFNTSTWNDNISFLSLRPDLDLCPVTSQHPGMSASALSLQYSPSFLSVRSEGGMGETGGSVGNLQGLGGEGMGRHRNEYSHSSLPSNVRLRAGGMDGRRKHRKGEETEKRPYSMYNTYHPGRTPFKPRPRSLAVSAAISEDGDYEDCASVCGSDMSDVSSLNNSVFSGGYGRTSTPLMTPTSPPLLEESGSDLDLDYRLPPPGMTPKILHDASRPSTSHSSLSLSSSKSSDTPPKGPKTQIKPKQIPRQYKQPTYAIIEKLTQEPTEPVLLKFKPLKNDFSFSTIETSSHSIELSSEETDSSEESFQDRDKKPNGRSYHTPNVSWNPCIRDSTDYNLQTTNSSPSPSPSHHHPHHLQNSSSALAPLKESQDYSNKVNDINDITSRVHAFSIDDAASLASSYSGSNGIKLDLEADCSLTEDEGEDIESEHEETEEHLGNKTAKNLNESAGEFRGVRLEYVNEDDESTDL